jgi:predicted AlkP superfamily pyrophosphatase or phosphodiesterase
MKHPKRLISFETFLILSLGLFASQSWALSFKNFEKHPRLVIVMAIDQFRADYLSRYSQEFLPATSASGRLGGFRYLMQSGAYFPFAEYPAFQNMTCSGHAMLLTGAPPSENGIIMNEWFDRDQQKVIYCAQDDQGELAPQRLKTSTVGDELKLSYPQSKTVSIALKDRAAMMLAGHKANIVLWWDKKTNSWNTSAYYGNAPQWLAEHNLNVQKNKGIEDSFTGEGFSVKTQRLTRESFAYAFGTKLTLDLAKQALKNENLGHNKSTDLLTLSLSNHDFLGHQFGFGSGQMKALTLEEDRQIADFLNFVRDHMKGLENVVIVLSADHGIAPNVDKAAAQGLPADKLDLDKIQSKLESDLTLKFGTLKDEKKYIYGQKYFHYYVNPKALVEKRISLTEALAVAKMSALSFKGVSKVFGRDDFDLGHWPAGLMGEQLKAQYLPTRSGDLVLIPDPFVMDLDENFVTHITGYSYDRQVPLIFLGAHIKPGVHSEFASVLDLAPTLSFMLGTVAPASAQGRVLNIFKDE